MRVAHFIPKQDERKFDTRFCLHLPDYYFYRERIPTDVDFIYAGSISVLPEAIRYKKRNNKPLVCWVWDIPYNWREWKMDDYGISQNYCRDAINKERAALLKYCDLVISASKWTQKVLKEQFNVDSKQIYYYIDTHAIDAVPNQEKEKQIIQISRFYYNKRFEDTIKSAKELSDYKFVLMGTGLGGHYGERLKEIAGDNVEFYDKPKRKEVIKQLKKSTLLVSPSVFEGWGITPIEAIYCNTLPILSDIEVFKELYMGVGIFHRRFDWVNQCNLIDQHMKEENHESLLKKHKERITEFTPEKFANRWRQLINESLNSRTGT